MIDELTLIKTEEQITIFTSHTITAKRDKQRPS